MQKGFMLSKEDIRQGVKAILKNQDEKDKLLDQHILSRRAEGLTLEEIFDEKETKLLINNPDNPEEKRLKDIKALAESTDLIFLLSALREAKEPIVEFEFRIETRYEKEYSKSIGYLEDYLEDRLKIDDNDKEEIVIYLIRHFWHEKNSQTIRDAKYDLCCYDLKEESKTEIKSRETLIKSSRLAPTPEFEDLLIKPDEELTEEEEIQIKQMILDIEELKPMKIQSALSRIMLKPEETIMVHLASQPNNPRVLSYLFELINGQLPKTRYSRPRQVLFHACMTAAADNHCLSNFITLFRLFPNSDMMRKWHFVPKLAEGKLNTYSALVEIKCFADEVKCSDRYHHHYYNTSRATEADEVKKRQELAIYLLTEYKKEFIISSPDRQREFYNEVIDMLNLLNLRYERVERFYNENEQLFEKADLYKILDAPYFFKYICLKGVKQSFVERCKGLTAMNIPQLSLEASWQINEIIGKSEDGFSRPILIDFYTECYQRLVFTLTELGYGGDVNLTIVDYLVPTLLERMQLKFAEIITTNKEDFLRKNVLRQKNNNENYDSGYWALFNAFKLYEELFPSSILEYHTPDTIEEKEKGQEKFYKQFDQFEQEIKKFIYKPFPGLTSEDFPKILKAVDSEELKLSGFPNLLNCLSELKDHTKMPLFSIIEMDNIEPKVLEDSSCILKKPDHLIIPNAITIHEISQTKNKMQIHCFFISLQGQWYVLFVATGFFKPLIIFSMNSQIGFQACEDKILSHVETLINVSSDIKNLFFGRFCSENHSKIEEKLKDDLKKIDKSIDCETQLETKQIQEIYQFSKLIYQCFVGASQFPEILRCYMTLVQMKLMVQKLEKVKGFSEFSGLVTKTTTLCSGLYEKLPQQPEPEPESGKCLIC